jgi:excisionase family DNA binding protein
MTPAPLLTINDLARLLGLSPKAIYNRRHRGELPRAIVLGHSLRWRPEDVEQWIAQQTEPEPDH